MYATDFKSYHKSKNLSHKSNNENYINQNWITHISKLLIEMLKDYCLQSSLHGFKYIGESSLPFLEWLFWVILVSFSGYVSILIIWVVYTSGQLQSIEMILNPNGVSIWEIPFPAVIVCPVIPVKKSFFDLEKNVNNTKLRHYSKLICPSKSEFGEVFDGVVDDDFFEFVMTAGLSLNVLITKCMWDGKEVQCNKIFKPIITNSGLCYTFNNFPGQLVYKDYVPIPGWEEIHNAEDKYWDMDTGYPERDENSWMSVYPYWSEWSGEGSGLTIDLVDNREEWQPMCSSGYSGYLIKIHPPIISPELINSYRVSNNMHTYFSINPELIEAESDLLSIPTKIRQCVFSREEHLINYFKLYSQTSCILECYMKKMLSSCHCIPYDLQRIIGNQNYMYCSDIKSSCNAKVIDQIRDPRRNLLENSCLCLPSCTEIMYHYHTSTHNIITEGSLPPWAPGFNNTPQSNISRVSIFLDSNEIDAYLKRRTTNFGDFLGSCGGLLGLLLGFSFMSAFEIIYFSVIRPTDKLLRSIIKKA